MINKKVVLITGAARGIGAAIANIFAKNNYKVIINYNTSKLQAEELAQQIINNGGEALAVKANISSEAEVEKMFKTAIATFGHIDVLINNAGVALDKLLIDCTENDFDNIISVNLKGAFFACKYALKNMLSNQNGCIINISSVWGQTGAANESLYSASKAALIGLTKALAKEYAISNIRVNAIAAGVIKTEMNNCYGENFYNDIMQEIPLNKVGQPSDVANAALFLAENANFVTGAVLQVNGGMII